jgi:hypothetical protein
MTQSLDSIGIGFCVLNDPIICGENVCVYGARHNNRDVTLLYLGR